MNPENKNGSDEILELIDKMNSEGRVEFDFSPKLPKTGLVFEEDDGTDDEDMPTPETNEVSAPDVHTSSPDTEPEPKTAELEAADSNMECGEFDVPDSFVLSEEFNTPLPDESTPMIWKTYIPRFTEVTQRQYRLRDDSAPSKEKENCEPLESAQSSQTAVKVDKIDPVTAIRTDIEDSTSEYSDGNEPDAVIVNVNGRAKHSSDSINVFKFPDGEAKERIVPTEEELEQASIRALFGKELGENRSSAPEENKEHTETSDKECSESETEEMREYSIPDLAETSENSELEPCADGGNASDEDPEGAKDAVRAVDMKSQKEYNSSMMREHFKDRFLDTLLSIRLRIIVAAVLSAVALAFENSAVFGVDVCAMLGIGGSLVAPALLDGLFVLALMALSIPELLRAISALKRKCVVPELSLLVSALAIVVYTAVIVISPTSSYPLFAFVYSILVLSSIYATYCLQNAAFSAFKLIADNDKKIVLDNRLTRTLEKENIALDGAVDEYDSRIARSFETTFVSDFFKRSGRIAEDGKNNLLVLALNLGIAVVTAAVMFFIGDGIVSSASSFALVASLGLPAFAVLSHKLPYANLQNKCVKNDCAVIGEQTYGEYAAVDVIAFEDSEIFGEEDVVLKSISLNDKDGDFRKVMRRMTSLFASLGGPLHRMFLNSIGKSFEPATDMTVEADGASGRTDGVMVMAGTLEYMERHGVKIPYESPSIASTKTMYAAENGVLFAKFSIQYSFSESFAMLLPTLREKGIVPLIYTRDPNITNELMRFLTGGSDSIRVMRRYDTLAEGTPKVYRRLSSGVVSLSDKTGVINLILLSKRYAKLQYGTSLTELAACAVGSALAAAIAVTNMMLSVPSLLLGVWQIAWCAALAVISLKTFGRAQKKKRKNK